MIQETSWHSYPKIYAIGHKAAKELFDDEVLIEEKVDGSQFSFGIFNGEIKCRSKGVQLVVDAPEAMFSLAVDQVLKRKDQLKEGWTYRGEYLKSHAHGTNKYERAPNDNIIIFDINPGYEEYLSYESKKIEAERLGFETVPCFFRGKIESQQKLLELMESTSVLGGCKIEGFVVKNYHKFGDDKKALMGKYVSEQFKEANQTGWRKENPTGADLTQRLIFMYKTEARWTKAIEHLRDYGALTYSPKDIGGLMKECSKDIHTECEAEIKEFLFNYYWPKVSRAVTGGLPEFYKKWLMEQQFKNAT